MRIRIGRKGESVSVSQIISLAVIFFVLFFSFFSPIYKSFGIVGYFFAILLLAVNFDKAFLKQLLPALLFATTTLLLLLISGRFSERGFNAPIVHAAKFNMLFLVLVIAVYMKKSEKKIGKSILWFSLLVLSVSILISLYYVFKIDKYAIRYNESFGYPRVLRFEQTYSICIFCVALFFALFSAKKTFCSRKRCLAVLFLFLLFAACLGVSLFTTALLIAVIGIFLALVVRIYQKHVRAFWILLLLAILILVTVTTLSEQVSKLIYRLTENMNWIIRLRVRGIADAIFSTNLSTEYSMERRSELASYSWETFKSHPIFGIGYREFGYEIIGMHQEWIDLMGTFGIVGTLLFAIMFCYYVRIIYKQCDNQIDRSSFIVCLCMFLALGVLNPCLSFPVLFALLCVAPNVSLLIRSRAAADIRQTSGLQEHMECELSKQSM